MLLELLVEKKKKCCLREKTERRDRKIYKNIRLRSNIASPSPPLHHPKAPPKQEEEEWKEKLETLGRFEDCSFPPFDSERDI
jgi:hypothetical protein